jgi:protease I
MECSESFEALSDGDLAGFSALIVPSGMVADRLRYSERPAELAPAVSFMKRAFANRALVKGIICHGLWLVSRAPELVRGRRVACHNNLVGDVLAYGAIHTDQDVVVDGDLVTGRSGGHAHLFARAIIDLLAAR